MRAFGARHSSALQNIRRGAKPSADRLEKLCEVLDLEFYIGPPKPAATTDQEPTSNTVADIPLTAKVIGSAGCSLASTGRKFSAPAAPLPADITDPAAYYVIATGHSMREEGIEDGDYVLASPARTSLPGDRVYFEAEPHSSGRIKRLQRVNGEFAELAGWLEAEPASSASTPVEEAIYMQHVRRLDTVVAVFSARPDSPDAIRRPDPRHRQILPQGIASTLLLADDASVDDAVAAIERLTARWRDLGDPASPDYTQRLAKHMLDHVERSRNAAPVNS